MGTKRKKKKGDYQNAEKKGNKSPVKAKKYLGQHFLKDEGIPACVPNNDSPSFTSTTVFR